MLRFVLIAAVFALAVYVVVRLIERRGARPSPRRTPGRPSGRPVAPDDDPEFLRHLDRKRRRDHPDA